PVAGSQPSPEPPGDKNRAPPPAPTPRTGPTAEPARGAANRARARPPRPPAGPPGARAAPQTGPAGPAKSAVPPRAACRSGGQGVRYPDLYTPSRPVRLSGSSPADAGPAPRTPCP